MRLTRALSSVTGASGLSACHFSPRRVYSPHQPTRGGLPMTHESHDMGKVWRIYLRISRFPILATTIRERMRHELFMRGIVDPKRFEEEVKEEAIESQQREGLLNPYTDEPSDIWERRLNIIRDQRTDYYFAYNFPLSRFDDLAREVLKQRKSREEILSLN